jgi:hypothetical protein
MSRGLGKVQRMLLGLIREFGEPMTFDQMRLAMGLTDKLESWPLLKRSLRRALHSMVVNSGELIALGNGGRADPYRYFFHPVTLYLMKDQALQEAFDADPGAKEAVRRDTTKLARALGRMSSGTAEGPKD